jgi:hypothetical protein
LLRRQSWRVADIDMTHLLCKEGNGRSWRTIP